MKKIMLIMVLSFALWSCNDKTKVETSAEQKIEAVSKQDTSATKAQITFYELGSVNCIPCKQMKPVMESIEKKYGDQIKVIFYDVNKEPNRTEEFGIRLIPTQVFINKEGKEIHRHEGFYPESEIDKFLSEQGLKIKNQEK